MSSEPSTSYAQANTENPKHNIRAITSSLVAGGIAGGVSRSAVAPLERLKILMQVQGKEKIYTGVWQGLRHMSSTEGLSSWFKGNGTNCIRIIPNSAIKFLIYEQLTGHLEHTRRMAGGSGDLNALERLVAGGVAGVFGMSATYPLDMVRGRLSIGEGQYRGLWHATRSIVGQEGLLALYKGWVPSVIGVVPYMGLNFGVYETLKVALLKHYDLAGDGDLGVTSRLACGAVAGTCGQTVAYPFDVARRRLQVSGWSGAAKLHADGAGAIAYTGMTDCFIRTVREEGVSALFKGIWPNYVKVVPSIAIAFVTYETIKGFLGVEFRISD